MPLDFCLCIVQYTTFHGTEYSFIHSFVHFNPEFKGNNNSEQTVGQDSKATRYALVVNSASGVARNFSQGVRNSVFNRRPRVFLDYCNYSGVCTNCPFYRLHKLNSSHNTSMDWIGDKDINAGLSKMVY